MPGKSQQENKKSWRCCLCVFAVYMPKRVLQLAQIKIKNQRFDFVFLYHTRTSTPHVLHNNTTFVKKKTWHFDCMFRTIPHTRYLVKKYQPDISQLCRSNSPTNKKNGASCRQEKTVDPDCPPMGLVPPSRPFPFTGGVGTPRHHTPHVLPHHTPPPEYQI